MYLSMIVCTHHMSEKSLNDKSILYVRSKRQNKNVFNLLHS